MKMEFVLNVKILKNINLNILILLFMFIFLNLFLRITL
jgi:hypothetical protein